MNPERPGRYQGPFEAGASAPELVALVRAGAKFVDGRSIERIDQEDPA